MNKFVECCRIKQKNKYNSAQISNIVDSEMASLYEQMQEKMGDVKGQSAKKTDSELFKITTLPKNSHELVEDPAQVLRLMQIAMDGQVGGKKLTYEQEGQLSGILSVCVRELNLNEKNKNTCFFKFSIGDIPFAVLSVFGISDENLVFFRQRKNYIVAAFERDTVFGDAGGDGIVKIGVEKIYLISFVYTETK